MRIGQKLSIPLFVVALGNLVDTLYRGDSLLYYFTYVLIFILIAIPLLITKREPKKNTLSMVLLFLSLIGFWFGGDSSLIGTTLLIYSIYLSGFKKSLIVYTSIAVILMIVRFTFTGQNPAQMAVYLAGSSFIFIIYHHYIHPKKVDETFRIVQKDENGSQINAEVAKILSLRSKGYDWPEINDKLELNISDEWCRKKVTTEARRLGYKNKDEFLLNLSLYGK